jgi:hypothetical protein
VVLHLFFADDFVGIVVAESKTVLGLGTFEGDGFDSGEIFLAHGGGGWVDGPVVFDWTLHLHLTSSGCDDKSYTQCATGESAWIGEEPESDGDCGFGA